MYLHSKLCGTKKRTLPRPHTNRPHSRRVTKTSGKKKLNHVLIHKNNTEVKYPHYTKGSIVTTVMG